MHRTLKGYKMKKSISTILNILSDELYGLGLSFGMTGESKNGFTVRAFDRFNNSAQVSYEDGAVIIDGVSTVVPHPAHELQIHAIYIRNKIEAELRKEVTA